MTACGLPDPETRTSLANDSLESVLIVVFRKAGSVLMIISSRSSCPLFCRQAACSGVTWGGLFELGSRPASLSDRQRPVPLSGSELLSWVKWKLLL